MEEFRAQKLQKRISLPCYQAVERVWVTDACQRTSPLSDMFEHISNKHETDVKYCSFNL